MLSTRKRKRPPGGLGSRGAVTVAGAVSAQATSAGAYSSKGTRWAMPDPTDAVAAQCGQTRCRRDRA
ncbi:hypothetical protein QNA23_10580 [Rhodococcus erythropolis]|uniref:hypothetical protein n=1 Tax=Rhodococcus erythropolis TaxID=1833 RepID=UPI0024B8CBEA|nr:hypothetical protein [Rhodococcus erythropolis]MDJ0403927.1 hypothetical protein [Rhodococcus erythropolis]